MARTSVLVQTMVVKGKLIERPFYERPFYLYNGAVGRTAIPTQFPS